MVCKRRDVHFKYACGGIIRRHEGRPEQKVSCRSDAVNGRDTHISTSPRKVVNKRFISPLTSWWCWFRTISGDHGAILKSGLEGRVISVVQWFKYYLLPLCACQFCLLCVSVCSGSSSTLGATLFCVRQIRAQSAVSQIVVCAFCVWPLFSSSPPMDQEARF